MPTRTKAGSPPPGGWTIPAKNTHHLMALLKAANAVLKGPNWVFPNQQAHKTVLDHITKTRTHAPDKLCFACLKRKTHSQFPKDFDKNGDGREQHCSLCKKQVRAPGSRQRRAPWAPPPTPPLNRQDPNFPPLNQAAFDRYVNRKYFSGAIKIVNVLLWWKTQNDPGDRLTADDFVPNTYLRSLVIADLGMSCPPIPRDCPARIWSAHIHLAKDIAKYAYNEHHQNLRAVGYRLCTEMSHTALEVLKNDLTARAYAFAGGRRLQDGWGMFSAMMPETRGVSLGVTTLTDVKMENFEAWTAATSHALQYLSRLVGFGRGNPPDLTDITKDMREHVLAAFDQTGQWFTRWGAALGKTVTIT